MSMQNAYSLYDVKSLTYSPPFYALAVGAAVRMLSDLVQDQGTSVGRHPSDYKLYCVGVFDDAKGELMAHSPILHVIDAAALVKIETQMPLFPNVKPGTSFTDVKTMPNGKDQ